MSNGKWQVIEPPPKNVCCLHEFQQTKYIDNRTEILCAKCRTRFRRKGNGTWSAEAGKAASEATPDIKELVELCRAYFHEGSDSLTREDIERIEQRIRELVQ